MPCAERVLHAEEDGTDVEDKNGNCRDDPWQRAVRRHPSVRECVLRARKLEGTQSMSADEGVEVPEVHEAGFEGKELSFGFSVCCAPQHPFPWVSAVTPGGAAEEAGLLRGDCLLTVGRTPLVGFAVQNVARIIREAGASGDSDVGVEVSFWRPREETCKDGPACTGGVCAVEPSLTVGMERLLRTVGELVAAVTCPVCLEKPIPKPAIQCTNGHLLCLQCRRKSSKCPVCRVPLRTSSGAPLGGRCLLADQLQAVLLSYCAGEYAYESFGNNTREPMDKGTRRSTRDECDTHNEEPRPAVASPNEERESSRGSRATRMSGLKHRLVGSRTGGTKALVRSFVSWLLASRRDRRDVASQESMEEGDIYRLCAAM